MVVERLNLRVQGAAAEGWGISAQRTLSANRTFVTANAAQCRKGCMAEPASLLRGPLKDGGMASFIPAAPISVCNTAAGHASPTSSVSRNWVRRDVTARLRCQEHGVATLGGDKPRWGAGAAARTHARAAACNHREASAHAVRRRTAMEPYKSLVLGMATVLGVIALGLGRRVHVL